MPEFSHFKQVYLVMFFVGFAVVPFKKFYQGLTTLVFNEEEKARFVQETKSEASLDSAEKQNSSNKLIASQSSNQILFNQRRYTGFAFSGEQGNAKSLTTIN